MGLDWLASASIGDEVFASFLFFVKFFFSFQYLTFSIFIYFLWLDSPFQYSSLHPLSGSPRRFGDEAPASILSFFYSIFPFSMFYSYFSGMGSPGSESSLEVNFQHNVWQR